MVVLGAVGVVLLVLAIRGIRASRAGNRWPFIASLILTGLVVAVGIGAALLALVLGGTTWNSWTAGTRAREEITLTVAFFGLPLLLVLAALMLTVGGVRGWLLRRRDALPPLV